MKYKLPGIIEACFFFRCFRIFLADGGKVIDAVTLSSVSSLSSLLWPLCAGDIEWKMFVRFSILGLSFFFCTASVTLFFSVSLTTKG